MTRRLLLLALALAATTAFAAGPPVPEDPEARALDQRLISAASKDSKIMKNLTYLSDVIGPRLTGSSALLKANEWTAEQMRSYGLTNVRLEPWTIPEGWERGTATAKLLEPTLGRAISIASMGWYPGTKGKVQGDVVFIKAETVKDLDAYKGKLKNAIVLMSPPRTVPKLDQLGKSGSPLRAGGPPRDFTRRNITEMMTFRRTLSDFLVKEGAAAIFQDAGKPLGLLVTTGGWGGGRDRASASNRLPTLFVAHHHYELLHRLATRNPAEKTRLELEVTNRFIPGPIKVFNTVGEIKGSEKPDEYVVVGAHLDSWDLAQGTTDNGTGSCLVLETARLLATCGVKPKRTIRFVLFTGEEQGLYGSRMYVDRYKDELARTSAAIVHDTGTGRIRGIGTGARAAHTGILSRELVSLKSLGVTDFTTPSMGGSDHMSFSRVGVPGFMMVQDMSTYTYTHHTQIDSLDAANEANLIQGAQVMSVMAMRVANLNHLLPRVPTAPTRSR